MCGIVGFLNKNIDNKNDYRELLTNMGVSISHRGPDNFGVWYDYNDRIGLSHRRLSILDLSETGHQPMLSKSDRYVIIFNGEIYNHLEIRKALENKYGVIDWDGHSDTETILKSIDLIGIIPTIRSLIGMFSIALWDKSEKRLYLVRDRLGEKPMYYGWQGDSFLFGSELKAFKEHPSFLNQIDKNSLSLYFRYNYIPAPFTIYKGLKKLMPGSILSISIEEPMERAEKYWQLEDCFNQPKKVNQSDESFYIKELETLLIDSVKKQMLSDVPLGAFLSGGIDSSTIVAIMQSLSEKPIKTFTIGFNEGGFNEAENAKKIAEFLGTDHTELYVTPEDSLKIIPKLPLIYDEPFSDSSQIPTFMVAQLAKTKVTVSLSGDAGDELFAGYNRYLLTNNIWYKLQFVPICIRKVISRIILGISPGKWNGIYNLLYKIIPEKYRLENFGDKIHKSAYVLTSRNIDELYEGLTRHWLKEDKLVLGVNDEQDYKLPTFDGLSNIEKMMANDTITYLPDDILVKVDRAAMFNSLETRVPFLDHRIVEFSWKIPLSLKIRGGEGKWLLKEVLYKYVPKELIERPKMGFAVPIDAWLRGPLKEWAEKLLDEDRLKREGLLNPEPIRRKWHEHMSGKRNWQHHLWDVLMFQAWYEINKK